MNKKTQSTFYIVMMIILTPIGVGWISNIIQLINIENLSLTTTVIVKFIGVIMVPLGSVMGAIGWF